MYKTCFRIILLISLSILYFLFAGCEEKNVETIITDQPVLLSSPDTVRLYDTLPTASFYISTDAPGSLEWKVTSKPTWLTVEPTEGESIQDLQEIIITADSSGLSVGIHQGRIEIISTGGVIDVKVLFQKEYHPYISVSDSELDFGDSLFTKSIYLISSGSGVLNWSIQPQTEIEWCSIYPSNGNIYPGDSVKVTISVSIIGLEVGEISTVLEVFSNASNGDLTIPLRMDVLAEAIINTDRTELLYDYFQDTNNIILYNIGNVAGSYTVDFGHDYFEQNTLTGSINDDDSTEIEITLNRTLIPSDTFAIESFFIVSSENNRKDSIPVYIKNYNPTLWNLGFQITDAEFCRATNRIIAISSDPNQIHLIDPVNQTIQSIDLVLSPNCVTIRFDGQYAAVGHDGLITYIDVTNWVIEKNLGVSTNAVDVILPSNGWIYVFPRTDQWTTVRCVEISNGLVLNHIGRSIRAGTIAKLHPSEQYIYGADNGLSPSDFEKYDISNDTLVYLYDSPYHGDYGFGGKIWISDDGLRLFARTSNVFRASTNQSEDMIYNGNFAGISNVQWVEHSSACSRIFVVENSGGYFDPYQSSVHVYGDEYLSYNGVLSLPKYLVQTSVYSGYLFNAYAKYAFVNTEGTELYLLAQAPESAGLLYDWSIISIPVSETP